MKAICLVMCLTFAVTSCGNTTPTREIPPAFAIPAGSTSTLIPDTPLSTPTLLSSRRTPLPSDTTRPPARSTDWASRWLKGIPCVAPCWEGIMPGKTQAADALSLLTHVPFVRNPQLATMYSLEPLGSIQWDWPGGHGGGSAIYQIQNTAHIIAVVTLIYPVSFRFHDVLTAFGPPNRVALAAGRDHGNNPSYLLEFIYLSHGFSVFAEATHTKPEISPNLTVVNPRFFVATKQGVDNAFAPGAYDASLPWQGMQSFDDYCHRIPNASCN